MILEYIHTKLRFTKSGYIDGCSKYKKPTYTIKCDKCGKVFEERVEIFENRLKLINKEWCSKCSKHLICSLAGYKGTHNDDGTIKLNKGMFSKKRYENMSKTDYEEMCKRNKKISIEYHKVLDKDSNLKEEHYKKVFKNSRIGYISRAQKDIYSLLKEDGFLLEQCIMGLFVDIVHLDRKIIIEYNGDMWHANPRMYKPDDYIEMIKMTAYEKWNKDRNRRFRLRRAGYHIIVIWENEWNHDRTNVLRKIGVLKDKNWSPPKWYEIGEDVKSKQMHSCKLQKNKYVDLKDVDTYLSKGWVYGWYKDCDCYKNKLKENHEIITDRGC